MISSVLNTCNSGSPFRQWNRGVQEAQGEFVWIAESDDVAEPDLLRTLVAGLEAHTNCGIAYCRSRIVDETGADTGAGALPSGPRWDEGFVGPGLEEVRSFLSRTNTIPNASAVIFRRDIFNRVGGAPSDMRYAGDWMLWCRMLETSDLFYSAAPLNRFRQHGSTQRHSAKKSGLWVEEGYRVLGYLRSQGMDSGSALEAGLNDMVRKWLESADQPKGGMTLEAHRTLYRIGSRVDPRLGARLVGRISKLPMTRSLRLLQGLLNSG